MYLVSDQVSDKLWAEKSLKFVGDLFQIAADLSEFLLVIRIVSPLHPSISIYQDLLNVCNSLYLKLNAQ